VAETFLCPRRGEVPNFRMLPSTDSWDRGHSLSGGEEPAGPACSFCGSLHPGSFMELIRAGWIVEPTDKAYKVYLARPLTDEERDEQRRYWNEHNAVAQAVRRLAEADGKTAEQVAEALDVEYERSEPLRGGRTIAKVYFQHLDSEQRRSFIELHNAGKMRVGYPGHLYVTPFFCRPADPPASTGDSTGEG
jgi:hypothetical protein